MKAMVLAAGLGTRLRPHTLLRPKPLFPVMDQPLLSRIIDQLKGAGFQSVRVNAHHLREQIAGQYASVANVSIQLEDIELGTGGGLRLALDYFHDAPFLVVNGDICHDIDLAWVFAQHQQYKPAVTMVLHDYPRFNNVQVDKGNNITGFGPVARNNLAFTGIQVIEPRVLSRMPSGVFYNIIDCYKELLADGESIRAVVVQDHYWTDMGTPEDYLALHGDIMKGQGPTTLPVAANDNKLFIGAGAKLGNGVQSEDWAVIGSNVVLGNNVSLSRVVVWDGAIVPDGAVLRDTIVTPGFGA